MQICIMPFFLVILFFTGMICLCYLGSLKKKQDSLIWMFLVYFQRQSEQLMQESRASVSHTECSERYFDLQSEYFPEIFLCLGEQGGGE